MAKTQKTSEKTSQKAGAKGSAKSGAKTSAKTIKVEQVGSPIRRHHAQRETLIGLRLNKIGRVAEVPDTVQTRGMISRVAHLLRVHGPQGT
jgi:large subunit ribosomal protein L30